MPGQGNAEPNVIQGSDGALYGLTQVGGATGHGTLFRLLANGTGYTVIHDFGSVDGGPLTLMQAADGAFYGTSGVFFKIDGNGSNYTILRTFTNEVEGILPLGPLLQASDGELYGTTFFGSTNNNGAIFTMNTNGTALKVLHAFGGGTDSANPVGGLIQGSDGALYGTASGSQGSGIGGTIFKIDTDGNNYKVLHGFTGVPNDGSEPFGSLVESSEGVLYGTTYLGGTGPNGGLGTIFKIGLDGNGYAPQCTISLPTRVQMANDPMPAW